MNRGADAESPERLAQPFDCGVEAVFEIDERVVGPEHAVQLIPRDERSAVADEHCQDPEQLVGQHGALAVFPKLARPDIEVYAGEAEAIGVPIGGSHGPSAHCHPLFTSIVPAGH